MTLSMARPPAPIERRLSGLRQQLCAGHEPFLPEPALPGGIVLPLWPAGSTKLNQSRTHEAEIYNQGEPAHVHPDVIKTAANIHNPSLEAHPCYDSASGAAVICVPGGGHQRIGVASGGTDFVPFFAASGIACIVLRPRLRADGYNMTTDAVLDTLQAVRIVRSNARAWGIDSQKIGLLGFSAGAELVAASALEFETFDPTGKVSARPDFVGLVYPGPTPFETLKSRKLAGPDHGEPELMGSRLNGISPLVNQEPPPVAPSIPSTVPPCFLTSAGVGDRIHALWATEYFTAMLEAGVPNTEMHIYVRHCQLPCTHACQLPCLPPEDPLGLARVYGACECSSIGHAGRWDARWRPYGARWPAVRNLAQPLHGVVHRPRLLRAKGGQSNSRRH